MQATLARAALVRHARRTLLAVLGVAVSAALLLDMVMLSSGMRESFREFLMVRGFQLRVTPKGTLPFDTEATVAGARAIVAALRADPDVETVSPVLGGQLQVIQGPDASRVTTAFGIGSEAAVQGDYEVLAGRASADPDTIVVNDALARRIGARIGDTLDVAVGFDPQLRTYAGRRRLVVGGLARFFYTGVDQPAAALPLGTLQRMGGRDRDDRVSLVMARVRDGRDVERVRQRVERISPSITAISTETALRQVDDRLKYFRQLAFILGAISLVVGFLLVATLTTVSVNERLGEIAVMRAIGVSRPHVVLQIVLESVALNLAGAAAGMALGLVTARFLNRILADFPGLPVDFDFFLFQPVAAYRALGLLFVSGVLAAVYPAWRASTLPIVATLRREAVA